MFTIYGRDNCVHCVRAKDLLESRGFAYEFLDTTDAEIRARLLEEVPSARTVPQIFAKERVLGTVYVGGFDDLVKYLETVR